jgi:hypothetical protein
MFAMLSQQIGQKKENRQNLAVSRERAVSSRRINTQFLRAIVPLTQKKAFQARLMTPPRFVTHAVVTAAPLPEGPEDPKIALSLRIFLPIQKKSLPAFFINKDKKTSTYLPSNFSWKMKIFLPKIVISKNLL